MNTLGALVVSWGLVTFVSLAYAADPSSGDFTAPDSSLVIAQQTDSAKPKASAQEKDKHWAQMQEHIKQMQTQMEKIHKTTDPKERQKLMQEHMQTMREHMKMMHNTGGCMMMDPMARSNQPGAGKPESSMDCGMMRGADSSQRQDMLERRVDMMQMMMDQMMRHQEATQAKPK